MRRRPTRLHSDRRQEPRLYARNSGYRRTSGRLPIAAHCPRSSTRDIVTSDVTPWSFAWPWPKDERECRNLVLLPKPREGYERTAPGPALPFEERGSWVLLRSFKNPKIQVRGFREAACRYCTIHANYTLCGPPVQSGWACRPQQVHGRRPDDELLSSPPSVPSHPFRSALGSKGQGVKTTRVRTADVRSARRPARSGLARLASVGPKPSRD